MSSPDVCYSRDSGVLEYGRVGMWSKVDLKYVPVFRHGTFDKFYFYNGTFYVQLNLFMTQFPNS